MSWPALKGPGGEVCYFASGVEDAVTMVGHHFYQVVGPLGVLVKVVVSGPYRVVEVEVTKEHGVWEEGREGCD